jgi:hypothetical protein
MDSYTIGNYSIISSLNERTIYIKVINTLTYMVYEIGADSKELRIQGSIQDIYQIISKCFEQKDKDNYDVSFTVGSGTMKILFMAKIGGFYNIDFEILLREKLMSNDGQLTLAFQRLEQRLNMLEKENKSLESQVNNMMNFEVLVWYYSSTIVSTPINSIELTITGAQTNSYHQNYVKYNHIRFMPNLKKLTFQNGGFTDDSFSKLYSTSVTELTIFHNGDGNFTSILELITIRVPNLKYLKIQSAHSLPAKNIIDEISASKTKFLKELVFVSCNSITSQAASLQGFCASHNIKLTIQ